MESAGDFRRSAAALEPNGMAEASEFPHQRPADEARAADHQDLHATSLLYTVQQLWNCDSHDER